MVAFQGRYTNLPAALFQVPCLDPPIGVFPSRGLKEWIAFTDALPEHFSRVLTSPMSLLYIHFTLALAAAKPSLLPTEMSEAELIAPYPTLVMSVVFAIIVGLCCELYLLIRYIRSVPRGGPVFQSLLKLAPAPWDVRDLAFVVSAAILVLLVGDGYFLLAAKLANLNEDHTVTVAMAGELFLRLIVLAGLFWYCNRREFDWKRAFGLCSGSRFRGIAAGVIGFFAIFPICRVTTIIYIKLCTLVGIKITPQPVIELFTQTDSTWFLALLVGFAVIVAPIFEETVFRGFAYPALKKRWGTWPAMLVVSAVFAAVHLHAPSFGPLFALGLGLVLGYEMTGSLLTPITMHALFNAGEVAMLLYIRARS